MVYYFSWYVLSIGAFLIVLSAAEFFAAEKVFALWKSWIFHKLFPLHGFLLVCGGLPLTFFRDTVSGKIMFCIGLIVVITGPFILLFPERVRHLFSLTEQDLEDESEAVGLVYFDAVIKGAAGAFFIFAIVNYGTL
jgi:hypothetical protein